MNETPPWIELIRSQRWAALGSIDGEGAPYVSAAAYAIAGGEKPGFVMHLSELAAHTRNLLKRPLGSLLISERDDGSADCDPQTLARITLSGEMQTVSRDSESFDSLSKTYVQCFPDSEMRFGFGDFHLFHFLPGKGNFVGGFGAAAKLNGEEILRALQSIKSKTETDSAT